MLFYIAILCPAVLSVTIIHLKNKELRIISIRTMLEYLISLVVNVLLSSLMVCALVGGDVRTDSFVSLSFFAKYTAIALFLAVVMTYIWIVIKTYIKIEFYVEKYENDSK